MIECTGTAVFSTSAGGKRKWTCSYCDSAGFADQGGDAFGRIEARLKPKAPAASPAAPASAPRPARTLLDA
ncbi:MAG: hypothetical protein V4609_13350 [Pseudomonadota bacterium]